ncbi:hypothetical protein Moror_6903 [Moniliophthora roreri MCA 2997]|uniref:Uncharacterized protein n=1 Tax=Moniliophthora roreri (strain MCA 2997) TaxID=1381753 RepID=V2XBY4_MONRO|nr:hypothetical protein Moror_6903 [Moniliophthora roreri MCA 2997]
MVHTLQKDRAIDVEELGQHLLSGITFDNIDINQSHATPNIHDKSSNLIHLTSGTFIPLQHGVTRADLDCSNELAEQIKIKGSKTFDDGEILKAFIEEFPDPLYMSTKLNH